MMRPLNDREWLEQIRVDMLARSLADYDHATSLLDTLSYWDEDANTRPLFEEVTALVEHVPTGPDTADRVQWLADTMQEISDTLNVPIGEAEDAVTALNDLRADLLVLLVEAGIAQPDVMPDDPISLLRMFLPVD